MSAIDLTRPHKLALAEAKTKVQHVADQIVLAPGSLRSACRDLGGRQEERGRSGGARAVARRAGRRALPAAHPPRRAEMSETGGAWRR